MTQNQMTASERILAAEDTLATARTALEKAETALDTAAGVAEKAETAASHPVRTGAVLTGVATLLLLVVLIIRRGADDG